MPEAGATHTVCIHCGLAWRTDEFNQHECEPVAVTVTLTWGKEKAA